MTGGVCAGAWLTGATDEDEVSGGVARRDSPRDAVVVQLNSDRVGVRTLASASKEATTPPDAAVPQPSSLPQLWIRVKVVPHRPGSANSDSASRRSEASSSSLTVSSRRDSSATLN